MALFKRISTAFSQGITVPKEKIDDLVFTYNPFNKIKLDTKVVVPKDFVCVVVSNHTICDLFQEGEYKLLVPFIPITTKVNKLAKLRRDNTFKDEFKGRLYFVNLKEFESRFGDFIKIPLKDDVYKDMYGKITFGITYKVVKPKLFLSELVFTNPVLNDKSAKECLGVYIEDILATAIKRQKISAIDFAQKNILGLEKFEQIVKGKCKKVGVEVLSFEFRKTILPAKTIQRLKEKNVDIVFDERDMLILSTRNDVKDVDMKNIMPYDNLIDFKNENIKNTSQNFYVINDQNLVTGIESKVENSFIDDNYLIEEKSLDIAQDKSEYIGENVLQVDVENINQLDSVSSQDNEINSQKICSFCGTKNDIVNSICINCKTKLN